MTMRTVVPLLVAGLMLAVYPSSQAFAQGAVVSGSVSATRSNGATSPTFSGAVAYQFNEVLGFGVELSHIAKLDASNRYPFYCCGPMDSHATVFTTNVRLEVPTVSSRVVPYVIGGGGVAAVTEAYDVYLAAASRALADLSAVNVIAPILPGPSDYSYTNTQMALTLGGGASVHVSPRLSIDVDVRALHLMGGNAAHTLGRFGGGISYRF